MDGIQVSNCITELTGPTITLGLATPLAGGGMLQELCAAAAVELAVMVGLSLFLEIWMRVEFQQNCLLLLLIVPYFELLCSLKVPWNSRNLLTVLFRRCENSCHYSRSAIAALLPELGKACVFRWERSELADSNRSCSKVAADSAVSTADRCCAGY